MANDRIAYPDNPLMAAAFGGFLSHALTTDWIVDQFEKETGEIAYWRIPRSPIIAMIDKASGHEDAIAEKFVDWLILNYWGENPFGGGDAK